MSGSSAAITTLVLVEKGDGLDAGDFDALAAADVLAHDQVVAADHVGAGLGEFGAVALVGAAGQLLLLGAHQPGQLILRRLAAGRAVQRGRLLFFLLVEKLAFVHGKAVPSSQLPVVSKSMCLWIIA